MDTSTSHPARVLLQQMAAYNMWATQRLHSHDDALPEAGYRRDAGLFFKTTHGTQQALAQRRRSASTCASMALTIARRSPPR